MISFQHLIKKRKDRIEARSQEPSYHFFQRFTSAILIFLLFLSQTIHIDFFDPVGASDSANYDIVSLFVDTDTYDDLRSEIKRYATDIQGYLPHTRTHIIVTDEETTPANIAAENEKLYYEGDAGDGIGRLVGTILIGNIPLPVVEKEGRNFPSLYPYTDFADKRFRYDEKSLRYVFSPDAPESTDVDIWHGVIHPSLGKTWDNTRDITKIGLFLDKTHEFYTRSGKFSPSTIPPRVFYYDGYTESRSVSKDSIYKYLLFLQNAENIAYKRFTKYLLSDIQNALRQFNQSQRGEEDEYFDLISGASGVTLGDDTISPDMVRSLPDIQTARPIMTYLKRFHELINAKTLGDIQKFVHNAGRYNSGTTLRLDHGAIDMSLTDEVALRTLKEANDNLESLIDSTIRTNNYARKIIIFDGLERHIVSSGATVANQANTIVGNIIALLNISGSNPDDAADDLVDDIIAGILTSTGNIGMNPPTPPPNTLYTKPYLSYFFGEKSGRIQSPAQCTLARGGQGLSSQFSRPLLAEANVAYDLLATEKHVATLSGDTDELLRTYRNAAYSCFPTSSAIKTFSYWGGNSPLALIGSGSDIQKTLFIDPPNTRTLSGFSLPIFSYGGMKETSRFSSPSLSDCLPGNSYEYGLLQPYTYPVTIEGNNNDRTEMRQWPVELGRFTCLTDHEPLEKIPSFTGSISDYREAGSCLYGSLILDSQYFDGTKLVSAEQALGNQCKQISDSNESDNTKYENRYYHTIDSLLKHVSPTNEEIRGAEKSGSTPSLAVDTIRSVEFLTPKGNIAKLTYPNFFQAEGNTVGEVRAWLTAVSSNEWNNILSRENSTSLSPVDEEVKNLLAPGNLPASPIDWNTLVSDELILQILKAKKALIPNISLKYKTLLESSLSYSHYNGGDNLPTIPRSENGYEIAYLGLTPFDPSAKSGNDDSEIQDYTTLFSELSAVNFSEEETGDQNPERRASAACGPPDGVNIFQWPQAIICWIKSIMPPKITAGSCGPSVVGVDSSGNLQVSFASGGLQGAFFPWENLPSLPSLSGPLEKLEFTPLSNTITEKGESAGMLSLIDTTGNPISAELHTIEAHIEGGVFLSDQGEETDIKLDTIESDILFRYRPIGKSDISLSFSFDNGAGSITRTIRVIDALSIRITPSAPLMVGGSGVTLSLVLTDTEGNILSGFEGAVSLSLPEGVGTFDTDIVEIHDGRADPISFTPGRLAGTHTLSLDISGIGSIDTSLDILPGVPFYIDGKVTDTSLEFALRDRYGNISRRDLPGTYTHDSASPEPIIFSSGVLSLPRVSGYARIRVPALSDNTISYTEYINEQTDTGLITTTGSTKIIRGIPFFVLYVSESVGKYEFLPDYNARYTVLAGDSYMDEASDILYDTTPGASQSLAVTTSTTSPYQEDTLFSVFPGGGYTLSSVADSHMSTRARIEDGDIRFSVYDSTSRMRIAETRYDLSNLTPEECSGESLEDPLCYERASPSSKIVLITAKNTPNLLVSKNATSLALRKGNTDIFTYTKSRGLSLAPGVFISPIDRLSGGALVLKIEDSQGEVARLGIFLSGDTGVMLGGDGPLTLDKNHAYTLLDTFASRWEESSRGYRIVRPSDTKTLDESLLGPSQIDSLSALSEIPGVGWHDKNKLLLSYAGGDTVGEASRWYHSYTMINLGDPVTHVDPDAVGVEKEGIDRTLGTLIATGNGRNITTYKTKDMDNDRDDDIVILYSDGFVDLLSNISGKFQRKEMIAHLPDFIGGAVELGDFMGDGYADILGIDASGSLSLIDNQERRFTRIPMTLTSGDIPTKISQYKVYDMDADGKDDIAYLTEGGELGILYGTASKGLFEKKILENNLGIRLDPSPLDSGGAIRSSLTPSVLPSTTDTGATDTALLSEVFYERSATVGVTDEEPTESITDVENLFDTRLAPNTTNTSPTELYVRSEYAPAYGLDIKKSYRDISSGFLEGGDRIEVTIDIKNTSLNLARNIKYLDTLESIFDLQPGAKYSLTLGSSRRENTLQLLSGDEYDIEMSGIDIPPGDTLRLSYEVTALSASYGTMIVDKLEKGSVGDDIYGDVGFETSKVCGDDFIVWNSTAMREYARSTRNFAPAELPPSLIDRLRDVDGNGIPDSIENVSTGALHDAYDTLSDGSSLTSKPVFSASLDTARQLTLGFSANAESEIESSIESIMNGLSCGFGGGSCIAFPINDAPLAPGASPSILGFPLLPQNLVTPIVSGLPIFAAPTICITPFGPIPGTWPPCPLGAGGIIQPPNISQFRLFVTPTLTLGVGAAMCMGPNMAGTNPLDPFIPYGNCIVAAKPLPVCKGDGSAEDGSVVGISGLGSSTDAWNSASCTLGSSSEATRESARDDILSYLRNPTTASLTRANTSLSNRGGRPTDLGGPLLRIGDGSSAGTEISISIDSAKPLTAGNIIKVKNRRISGFPEFLMDWASRQMDEVTNKLLTLPNLVIVLPRNFSQNGVVDGSFSNFLEKFSSADISAGFDDLKTKMGSAYDSKLSEAQNKANTDAKNTNTSSSLLASGKAGLSNAKQKLDSTLAYGNASASSLKAAYQFISTIPFLRIEQEAVPINIPWILPNELDKYARALDAYKSEIERAKGSWCVGKTGEECLRLHTSLGIGALSASIETNLKRLEEYKKFPEKIQKYLTWKERYIAQLLCNVEALEKMLGGWYRDNGIRFRKWAEFYVLMKAIVSSWQPLIDIFKIKEEECSVCRNERWDLKTFTFKLISAIIPQLPIIQFPRWPDIVLDLSDIRFGIVVKVPDFRFNISPIRLPDLPLLSLPSLPNVTLNLPAIPTLPPIPTLPDLPDLPSLPTITLPSLPPPPKIPKIFGAVAAFLKIAKLVMKLYCFYQKRALVPENRVGSVIAQRTDRQATLPFDFLSVKFPQIAIPSIREIRVSTHINLELRSEFIAAFAKNAVKPINAFTTDLGRGIPKAIAPDIRIDAPTNINLTPQSSLQSDNLMIEKLEKTLIGLFALVQKDENVMMDTDEFRTYFRGELLASGLDVTSFDRMWATAQREVDDIDSTLEKNRSEHFRLIKGYLDASLVETREQEKLLERLSQDAPLLSLSDLPRALFIARDSDISQEAYEQYRAFIDTPHDLPSSSFDTPSRERISSLQGQMSRLLADTDTTTSNLDNTAAGYSPLYEGHFILSPVSYSQMRLFDYTDLIRENDRVQVIDIDKDSDDDYIYTLDGDLYIKYTNLRNNPLSPDTTPPTITDIDTTIFPEAPDYFHENVASPGKLEISFSPSNQKDTNFRLEFFDRYLEWDRVKENSDRDFSDTPRTVIDLSASVLPDRSDANIEVTPVSHALLRVEGDGEGFLLEGMRVSTIRSGIPFSLTAGRPLYTGNTAPTLSYSTSTGVPLSISLEKFRKYVFRETLSGSLSSGRAYILTPSLSEKLSYSDDMIGMPLLGDTKIISPSKVQIYLPATATTYLLPESTEYRHIALGNVSENYNVAIDYSDGFYSARLHSLSSPFHTRAGVTLIAPQASLDQSPPVLDISGRERIPVYQTLTKNISDIVTEMSPYTLTIDPDTTIDSDGNGIFDDDFTTSSGGVTITGDRLIFGPFDTLGERNMNIQVRDMYGNVTLSPFEIEVYAPIPQITTASLTGYLRGILDVPVSAEPIDIFRIREGHDIANIFPRSLLTATDGSFSTGSIAILSGALFTYSSGTLLLDERTGLPDSLTGMSFAPASQSGAMSLSLSRGGKVVLREFLLPPETLSLSTSGTLSNLTIPSLLLKRTLPYTLTRASFDDPNIPSGYYLLDTTKKALLAIDTRGQIYSLDNSLRFAPRFDGRFLQITVKKSDSTILELTYKVDFFYTVKK